MGEGCVLLVHPSRNSMLYLSIYVYTPILEVGRACTCLSECFACAEELPACQHVLPPHTPQLVHDPAPCHD